jgi:hypothetical protein
MGVVIVEKDFWVCWTLRELFSLPEIGEHLLFKGGTSLSKVWRIIERFSEDIDISLSRDWLGFGGDADPERAGSGGKQRERIDALVAACIKKIKSDLLPALRARAQHGLGETGWTIELDPDEPQTLLFRYPTALPMDGDSAYVRREVKIECGARSDAWPAESRTIQPYVADGVEAIKDASFAVRALSAERTFWEKATILHAEANRHPDKPTPVRYSRHYADLAAFVGSPVFEQALASADLRERVVQHKQVFFTARWAKYHEAVPGTFRVVPERYRLDILEADYRDMGEMYFGRPLTWSEVLERLHHLQDRINQTGAA